MDTPRVAYISRTAGPLVLDGILAPALGSLVNCIARDAPGADLVVADLSVGAWRSHAVASEFYAQLGLDWPWLAPPAPRAPISADDLPPYAETIGAAIDAETRGDAATLHALELARRFVEATGDGRPRIFLVLLPRFGLAHEPEDLLFIRFLAHGLRTGPSRLVLASADPGVPIVPGGWVVRWRQAPASAPHTGPGGLLSLVPGVVEPEVSAAIAGLDHGGLPGHLPLAGGRLMIVPELRRPPCDVPRLEYDRLAAVSRHFGWLEAYAQSFGNNFFVDPWFLCGEAWRRFAEGGHGLALRLLRRAITCSRTPTQHAICQSLAQGIQIALQRFEEAAEVPDPSATVPQALRGFLLQAKGWALAMTDQPAAADAYLRAARGLLEPFICKQERLYLMNIWALSQLKLGHAEAALATEKEIEAGIAAEGELDSRLYYINALNTARLYRRRADFDAAARYYRRSFATTLGVRSVSDSIYANFCLAALEAQRGAQAEAFPYWLRACLHWASSDVPEALAPRVVASILGRKPIRVEENAEEVSAALISRLIAAVAALGGQPGLPTMADADADLDSSTPPVFLRVAELPQGMAAQALERAVGASGWGVLVASSALPAPFEGLYHRRLRSLLHRLLTSICPDADLGGVATFVIDDRFGHEIPATVGELLDVCIRLGIPEMVFGTERIALDPSRRAQLERAVRVQLGSAVVRVESEGDGAIVTFKRYLTPRRLPGPERGVLDRIGDRPTLEELAARIPEPGRPGGVVESVRMLERWRVVNVSLPEDAYVQQGMVPGRLRA